LPDKEFLEALPKVFADALQGPLAALGIGKKELRRAFEWLNGRPCVLFRLAENPGAHSKCINDVVAELNLQWSCQCKQGFLQHMRCMSLQKFDISDSVSDSEARAFLCFDIQGSEQSLGSSDVFVWEPHASCW